MALLDFLKNKEGKEKAKKAAEKKPVKASVAPKAEKVEKKGAPVVEVKASLQGKGFSYNIVKEPHISEKASVLAESDKYTFKVYSNTNKLEIKKSVQGIYGVNVLRVNIIKSPKKKRRLGRTEGYKKAFTKAVVTVKAGQKIEIL
ncbi:MAG: 50S ribosomal protein L23 [Candidatus Staskawiczbacteria bacterium]|nr:50S ribosomal protein L23 [Candidatus Staskawiczbacteria bacterium]